MAKLSKESCSLLKDSADKIDEASDNAIWDEMPGLLSFLDYDDKRRFENGTISGCEIGRIILRKIAKSCN